MKMFAKLWQTQTNVEISTQVSYVIMSSGSTANLSTSTDRYEARTIQQRLERRKKKREHFNSSPADAHILYERALTTRTDYATTIPQVSQSARRTRPALKETTRECRHRRVGTSSPKDHLVDISARMTLNGKRPLTSLPSRKPGVSGLHAAAAPARQGPPPASSQSDRLLFPPYCRALVGAS